MKRFYSSAVVMLALMAVLTACVAPAANNDAPANVATTTATSEVKNTTNTSATTEATTTTATERKQGNTPTTKGDEFISRDEAKRIALSVAGVVETDVTRLQIELDYDDDFRRWEYEVSFQVGRTEYECELHAENGTVIHLETDIDD